MIMKTSCVLAASIAALCVTSTVVRADSERDDRAPEMHRARFSGGRLLVEILAGELVGAAAAYGTYTSVCGDEPCLGGALGGWVVDFAVTPAAIWGAGTLMGGRGRIGHAYYGALPALAPFSVTSAPVGLQFSLSAFFLPITSALMYELSSNITSTKWTQEHAPNLTLRPLYKDEHVAGALGTLSLQF
jgi:hypothetical protein